MNENNIEPQATKGSQNKVWYIIGGILVLIVLVRMFSGSFYGNGRDRTIEQATGGRINYGAGNMINYKTDNGSVTIGGNSLPSTWPSDAPQYPGAQILYSGSQNPQTGEAGVSIVFQVNANVQTVVDFYKRELVAKGWKIDTTATMGSSATLGATKGVKTFGVYIVDSGNGTVNVTVGIGGI